MSKQQNLRKITAGVIALALILGTPAVGFAQNGNGNKNGNNKDKSCLKAVGHLISNGWKKNNAEAKVKDTCDLPFGITKKLDRDKDDNKGKGGDRDSDDNDGPSNDTTDPTVSNVNVSVLSDSRARIEWDTNEKSDSTVFLSKVSPVNINSQSTLRLHANADVRDHSVVATNLEANTTYFGIIHSEDASGNVGVSGTFSFKTQAGNDDNDDDETAPRLTRISLVAGEDDIEVRWRTNEATTARVFYGTAASIDVNNPATLREVDTRLSTNHRVKIDDLEADTLYYIVIESRDASGNVQTTTGFTLRTMDES